MKISGLSRMAGYTLVMGLVYLVGVLVSNVFPGSILGVLRDLGVLGLFVSACYYLAVGARKGISLLFWKVRNKIIVSYAFIGIIPVAIMTGILLLVLVLVLKASSSLYLERELKAISDTLQSAAYRVSTDYLRLDKGRRENGLQSIVSESFGRLPAGYESARFEVYRKAFDPPSGDEGFVLQAVTSKGSEEPKGTVVAPSWIRDEFSDFIVRGKEVSFVTVRDLDSDVRLIIWLPFDARLIDYLQRRTSIEMRLSDLDPESNPSEFSLAYDEVGLGQGFFALSWAHFFQPVQWLNGASNPNPWTIFISVPIRSLIGSYLARGSESLVILLVFFVVALLVVELLSFLIGITIARSITGSISNIYAGAESIQKGDFGFRIPSRKRDQLDAMADSFNEMSASIVKLMDQVSEREALEKELEIAKEVQIQLFPQDLPRIPGLEIAASCTPARQVSGDYYDLLPHGKECVDVVLGDISGKGISAALLMASSQASIRSGLEDHSDLHPQSRRMATVAKEVNRQIYRRSSPELYSTLVLSHYDSSSRILSYCNAGHHPPLVFSDSEVKGLTVGGTVVGLFENWNFEGSQVELKPGSLVVYFTDGVVEAAKENGEQFGTDRLVDLVRSNQFLTADDIQSLIVEQVFDWSEEEQADDITVVCLKVLE